MNESLIKASEVKEICGAVEFKPGIYVNVYDDYIQFHLNDFYSGDEDFLKFTNSSEALNFINGYGYGCQESKSFYTDELKKLCDIAIHNKTLTETIAKLNDKIKTVETHRNEHINEKLELADKVDDQEKEIKELKRF